MFDIKAVSELLGHADVGITLRVYHRVAAKSIREMHRECSPICAIASHPISKYTPMCVKFSKGDR